MGNAHDAMTPSEEDQYAMDFLGSGGTGWITLKFHLL